MKSEKNIVLVGMMGSGKSLIGKLISEKLKKKFIDIDKKVEDIEKKKISEIFKVKGEEYFRETEEKISLDYLSQQNQVISLGGGGFINLNIRKKCKKNSLSFWLKWSNNILIKRIYGNKKRPVILDLNKNDIKKLILERSKIYNLADYVIDCDNLSKNEIISEITLKNDLKNNKN